jgi:hypothetical protein
MTRITDEEREERVNLVGEYITANPNASVRSTAKHFQEIGFSMSYVTVQDYIQRYKKRHPEKSDYIQQIVDSRKPLTVESEETKERILREANMVIEGYTLANISDLESIEYWTVVRDLGKRLPLLDKELYEQVKAILTQNSMDNLVHKEPKSR